MKNFYRNPKTTSLYLIFTLLTLCAHQPALAAEPSMSFSFQREDYSKYGLGLYQVIHANGAITDGSYDRLKMFVAENNIAPGAQIYLNSRSGNRLEGMRLGRLIRSYGLMTHIGNTSAKEAGNCISACAFAYLGGTYRFMNESSNYGVHSFYRSQGEDQEFTLEQSKDIAKRMTDYMREMGVNTKLFKYMDNSTKSEIVLIDKPTLQSLSVVNDGIIRSSLEQLEKDGIPYIQTTQDDYKGHHSLHLYCDRQFATLRGVAMVAITQPQLQLSAIDQQGIAINEEHKPTIGTLEIGSDAITYNFAVTPELAKNMATASKLGVYLQPKSESFTLGFEVIQTTNSKDTMKNFVNTCFGKQIVSN